MESVVRGFADFPIRQTLPSESEAREIRPAGHIPEPNKILEQF